MNLGKNHIYSLHFRLRNKLESKNKTRKNNGYNRFLIIILQVTWIPNK